MKKILLLSVLFTFLIPASLFTMDISKLHTNSDQKTIILMSSDQTIFKVEKNIALESKLVSKNIADAYYMTIDKQNLAHCIEIMKITHNNKHKQFSEMNNKIKEYIKTQIPKHKIDKLPHLIKALYELKVEHNVLTIVINSFIDKLKREYHEKRALIENKIISKFKALRLQIKVCATYYARLNAK